MFPVDHKTTELMAIEVQKKVNEQKALDARCKEIDRMCRKADRMSLIRHQQFKSLDEEDRTNALKAKEARERQIVELEREQNLARVMEDLKRRETVEVKNKQLLQTNSHELRHVEKQLRTAYAQKELLCQIKENEALKKEEKVREYYEDLKMIESGKNDSVTEIKRIARENEFKSEYKMAIEEQIQEMNERRRQETSPSQLGCSVVFEPTENSRKLKQDLKINRCEKETEELEKIRNELKECEREEDNKMDRRIKDYLTDVEERTKSQEEIKNKINEEKNRVYKYLADNLISSTADTSEKDEIRMVLAREQQRNAVWLAERREKELKKLRQDEMLKQNDMQLKLKEDSRKDEKEKDLAEVKKYLQSYRELNAVTEKKDRDRRQTMIDYRNELKELIDVRNDLRIEQKTTEKNEFVEAANLERLRLEEIEKEQKIYIDSHAETLKGFFSPPKNYCSKNYEK